MCGINFCGKPNVLFLDYEISSILFNVVFWPLKWKSKDKLLPYNSCIMPLCSRVYNGTMGEYQNLSRCFLMLIRIHGKTSLTNKSHISGFCGRDEWDAECILNTVAAMPSEESLVLCIHQKRLFLRDVLLTATKAPYYWITPLRQLQWLCVISLPRAAAGEKFHKRSAVKLVNLFTVWQRWKVDARDIRIHLTNRAYIKVKVTRIRDTKVFFYTRLLQPTF